MDRTYSVRCPNCGGLASRHYFTSQEKRYSTCQENQVLQTECPSCDYLMIACFLNGNVIEAHSSSTSNLASKQQLNNSDPVISTSTRSILPRPTKVSA
ncbi:MAG: hypothetical protein QNJ72_43825 [Pleurocapsa sp. MO_226.B13]|nr:hypothetical protein [Pleurocapsa sp. MO_226.B13]